MKKNTGLNLSSLSELGEQSIFSSQGKGEGVRLVVVRVGLEVLDNISQKMCPLHSTSWGLIAQLSEMDMQVVVGGLVVQVDSQLTGRKFILLHYGFLRKNKTGDLPTWPNFGRLMSKITRVISQRPGHFCLTFPFWKTFFSNGRCSAVNPLILLMPFWWTMAIRYKSSTWQKKSQFTVHTILQRFLIWYVKICFEWCKLPNCCQVVKCVKCLVKLVKFYPEWQNGLRTPFISCKK